MPATRQLAAILFADIQGYTALMEQDEDRAITLRSKFEQVTTTEVEVHSGKIVQHSGDGALCIFNSAIEAVRAAIGIQMAMLSEPTVPLRVGIHSGDVIFEAGNVYGDGVNVASRIESFAVAGSVFVSDKVYDEIRNQTDIRAKSLGRYQLKNVNAPLEIYAISSPGFVIPEKDELEGKGRRLTDSKISGPRILMLLMVLGVITAIGFVFKDKFSVTSKDKATPPPVVAVLPFTNLSASKDDEYFADGICDEILTQISKIGELNVVSRTSTLQYKGTKKSVRQIARELGADVLLEGSVQKSNDQFRIIVQLVDAKTDKHLWAETYIRETKDVFAVQSEIARQVAASLNAALSEKEKLLFDVVPTDNLQAYDFYLRGNKAFQAFQIYLREEDAFQAVRMYEQAIKLDPRFTAPYQALVNGYIDVYWEKVVLHSDMYRITAKQWLDKLIALKIDDPYVHNALASYKFKGEGDFEGALAELDEVDRMLGNGKSTYLYRSEILRRMGRIDEAMHYLKKQAERFPRQAEGWAALAETYKLKRDFDSCEFYINKALEINPEVPQFHRLKSMYYAELKGDTRQARQVLQDASALVDAAYFAPDYNYFEVLEGNYPVILESVIHSTDSLGHMWQYSYVPDAFVAGLICRLQGQSELSRDYFQKTIELTSPLVQNYPDEFRFHATLGVALAGAGKRDESLMEANKACEMMPPERDVILAISALQSQALTHIMLGEEDKAIDILERLLQMPFAWTMTNSVALYRIHYYWKPLQSNPRFQKIIQQPI